MTLLVQEGQGASPLRWAARWDHVEREQRFVEGLRRAPG
jgi:hypothetical protein